MRQLSDEEFERRFAEGTLNPAEFNHEAHVRLAWIHLTKYPQEEAIHHLCTQIAAYDLRHGDGTKFHKTLTVAAACIVLHHIRKSHARTFPEFMAEFPLLRTDFSRFVFAHYSREVLTKPEAKDDALAPDLMPFP